MSVFWFDTVRSGPPSVTEASSASGFSNAMAVNTTVISRLACKGLEREGGFTMHRLRLRFDSRGWPRSGH
ncbi:hypothetical protein FQZ97_661660 [compost metagenome]